MRATASAAEMAELMLKVLLPDLPFSSGDRVAVLLSGLGATPLMEQYILYGEVARRLQAQGITVAFNQVGNLFTSLEMMGVTLTLMKLDEQLESCLRHPCRSVGLTVAGAAVQSPLFAVAPSQAALVTTEPVRAAATVAARAVVGAALDLTQAGVVVRDLITVITENRQYLSEIDGLIGDGDHGINMAKGFAGCGARLDALGVAAQQLPIALEQLSQALMDDIGGSMGPLYGAFFAGLFQTLKPHAQLDAALFGDALTAAVLNVQSMGSAQVGDKTLIDTLHPALNAYRNAQAAGREFAQCLQAMSDAAAAGRDSTRDLQARIGRSARLGARSIGVLDAGATSCCLILQSTARSLQRLLDAATPI